MKEALRKKIGRVEERLRELESRNAVKACRRRDMLLTMPADARDDELILLVEGVEPGEQ